MHGSFPEAELPAGETAGAGLDRSRSLDLRGRGALRAEPARGRAAGLPSRVEAFYVLPDVPDAWRAPCWGLGPGWSRLSLRAWAVGAGRSGCKCCIVCFEVQPSSGWSARPAASHHPGNGDWGGEATSPLLPTVAVAGIGVHSILHSRRCRSTGTEAAGGDVRAAPPVSASPPTLSKVTFWQGLVGTQTRLPVPPECTNVSFLKTISRMSVQTTFGALAHDAPSPE